MFGVVGTSAPAMENTFDGITLNTILIDIVKCILFNKIRKIKGNQSIS